MRVNIVSESVVSPKTMGGVHTSFLNYIQLLRKKKVTITINGIGKADVTHIHTIGPFALYKLLTSHRIVMSSHHLPESFIGSYKGGKVFQPLIKKYLRFFYNHTDLILAMNGKTKEALEKLGVTTPIHVLPNSLDTDKFKPNQEERMRMRKHYTIKPDAFVALGVGYQIPRKGISDFILLARTLPEITFVWVGGKSASFLSAEGSDQKELFSDLPSNVILAGQIDYTEIVKFYTMADVLLFPSYQETQGMVIVEAAACGLPLILRDLPEYPELYGHSYLSCRKIEDFKQAIQKLSKDKNFYKQKSEESITLAKKFSYDSIGKKLVHEYQALLS